MLFRSPGIDGLGLHFLVVGGDGIHHDGRLAADGAGQCGMSCGIRAEVGFVLAHAYWGAGYALEAMHAVIDHVAGLGLKRLTARIHIGNHRSESLLRKLHFQEEGYLRGHVDRDGERRDCKLYGLLL